jgi:hypothetical protein
MPTEREMDEPEGKSGKKPDQPRVTMWREWFCECCGKTWAHFRGRPKPKHRAQDCPGWGTAGETWASVRRRGK